MPPVRCSSPGFNLFPLCFFPIWWLYRDTLLTPVVGPSSLSLEPLQLKSHKRQSSYSRVGAALDFKTHRHRLTMMMMGAKPEPHRIGIHDDGDDVANIVQGVRSSCATPSGCPEEASWTAQDSGSVCGYRNRFRRVSMTMTLMIYMWTRSAAKSVSLPTTFSLHSARARRTTRRFVVLGKPQAKGRTRRDC